MLEAVIRDFRNSVRGVDSASLRFVERTTEKVCVRQGVLEPLFNARDLGVMVAVRLGRGSGYAATSNLSRSGIQAAFHQAKSWAERTRRASLIDLAEVPPVTRRGRYRSTSEKPLEKVSLKDRIDLCQRECERLRIAASIVDAQARLWCSKIHTCLVTTEGGHIEQETDVLIPDLRVTANRGAKTQTRSFGEAFGRQGGLEVLEQIDFYSQAPRIAEQALELLDANDCPAGVCDVVLAPDQMILQIHESIGHPLELDRILGDERNYAGTTFVTLDMLGSFQYGSPLLNVTFDPTRSEQLASYAFDDEGTPAKKEYIIKDGLLLRPLGGSVSQARAEVDGVACARASGWSRPPIDRMANLNLEPGDSSLEEMIRSVEHGVYMETNCSWSIDDSRNKFQFGCEYGKRIENGELKETLRNPNYRGLSQSFWRNLKAVGDESTFRVMGTPYCGKGEPNQMVAVGHASPACRFQAVEVFGAA